MFQDHKNDEFVGNKASSENNDMASLSNNFLLLTSDSAVSESTRSAHDTPTLSAQEARISQLEALVLSKDKELESTLQRVISEREELEALRKMQDDIDHGFEICATTITTQQKEICEQRLLIDKLLRKVSDKNQEVERMRREKVQADRFVEMLQVLNMDKRSSGGKDDCLEADGSTHSG
ncbi:hypothetical protein ONS95_001392 [Cadophora gregata]|uniref:uncharacterized protein n=1 Tax=Cadophora gregata TaxID=51156 RepID=UPI0026DC873E|nr:uncharacterized protein ONS95_001392 [Cadophora gregata]KAK0111012.1 hypothetical protein ONS95_001392 [Cadophora gregata]KAK0112531.1 hypothetical protein ONS96_001767 [Cadophora gregata f. sp. sojae]